MPELNRSLDRHLAQLIGIDVRDRGMGCDVRSVFVPGERVRKYNESRKGNKEVLTRGFELRFAR